MSNTAALRVDCEREAAMALMQLSLESPDWSMFITSQTTSDSTPKRTENRLYQTEYLYKDTNTPSTSTRHVPFHVSLDLKVQVAAENSKHQNSEVYPSNFSTPKIVEYSSGGLVIEDTKINCLKQSRNTNHPAAARKGKRSSSNKNNFKEQNGVDENKMDSKKIKHDVATQTDYYNDPYQRLLEKINMLRATKLNLEAELKYLQERTLTPESFERSNSEEDYNPPSVESGSPRPKYLRYARKPKRKTYSCSSNTGPSMDSDDDIDYKPEQVFDDDEDDDVDDENLAVSANRSAKVAMVPIGGGRAKVPSSLLKTMDWSSYSHATRKLLTAVFPRKVLATHSLSGKPSPAFPGKKAKTQLDPDIVNDIIQTVMDKCETSEARIRTSITTKCADESKMYRNRIKNRKRRSALFKKENLDPHKHNLPFHYEI